jgi:hypothetical protein
MLELPVEPMPDVPALDEPMPDEPMPDEPMPDEPMRGDESMPLHALSAATQMAESKSFFISISFEQLSDAAPCGRRHVCHHHHG